MNTANQLLESALPGGKREAGNRASSAVKGAERAVSGPLSGLISAEAPQLVIRGANSQPAIQCGWLRGTLQVARLDDLISALRDLLPGTQQTGPGLAFFTHGLIFENSARICWSPDLSRGRNHNLCYLELPGSALEGLGFDVQLDFIRTLHKYAFQCSRLDASFDDYTRKFRPILFLELAELGYVCGFRRVRLVDDRDLTKPKGERTVGETVYFGRRGSQGSGAMYRFYDKAAESQGEINAFRIEVELADEKAKTAFRYLAESKDADDYSGRLGQLIGGHIDFKDRDSKPGEKNLERIPRCPLWSQVLEEVGRVKLKSSRPLKKIEKSIRHCEKVLPRQLAKIKEFFKHRPVHEFHAWIVGLISAGRKKLSVRELTAVKAEALGVDLWSALFPERGPTCVPN